MITTKQPVKPVEPSVGNSKTGPTGDGKVNILIIDDRDDKMLALEAVLSSLNQNIVKAHSGKEGLRHLLHQDFAVILLDVAMPGMDGFETATLIRKRMNSEHTPIIFVTSMNDRDNHIAQGYKIGAVDYILSPVVPEILRTKVGVFVDLYKKTEEIKRQAERLRQIEEAEHNRKLADAVDRLEAETKRNRFFTLSIDLLAIADFEGRMLQLNPTWEKVLGYSENELRALSGLDLVHPADYPEMCEKMRELKAGSTVYLEARYRRKDGELRWLGWTAAPFLAEKLIYIFARDITSQKNAAEEIRMLNGELNSRVNELIEINKELESFTYSISHDLRAPLRSMQSFAGVLLEEYGPILGNDGKRFAERIVQSSGYMDTLLHDLLDYSRLSRTQIDPGTVKLESVIDEILLQIRRDVEERKAVVEIERPLLNVCAHVGTVRQVLLNLISNSLKFVDPALVPTIKIWTKGEGDRVRIFVKDNGIGIAPEHQEKIFGLFERLHTREIYPGTGVGLALVRKGVERMGGRAGVDSTGTEGSCFWVELAAVKE
jgi:PAS domain S-box-containing protein